MVGWRYGDPGDLMALVAQWLWWLNGSGDPMGGWSVAW